MDVARRDKTEESCARRICPSLSRPLQPDPPPVCSCCRRCRADTRICSWTTLYSLSIFCFFFCFFCRLVLLKYTLMEIICCCLLLLYLCISLFSRFFHRQTNCMRQGSTVIVLYQKEAAQSTIYLKYKWFAYLLVHRLKTGSGRRHYPRYAHKQSTPTTKTVVRFYSSCVTLFYTLNTISSCAVVFGRIFTLTYIRMRALLWPSSNRCVPPSKG